MIENQREAQAARARQRIIEATAACLVRDGLANTRMAGIAKAAGVSSGLLHYHFETKERLFAEVLRHSGEVSVARTAALVERAGEDPAQRLAAFLDRCLPSDPALLNDWLLWQELALLGMRDEELSRVGEELYEALYAETASIMASGVEGGVFAPATDDLRTLAEAVVALCDGLGTRVLSAGPDLTLEAARASVALTVGLLLGHRGPLPAPLGAVRTDPEPGPA